jgi:zinc protease
MKTRVVGTRLAVVVLAVLLPAALQAQAAKWPSSAPPRPLPAHDFKFPPYDLKTLPNGMPVVVVTHAEQPVISLRMIVRAGAAQDPPAKLGLASLAATLLDQGTASRTARQIAEAIDAVGGQEETAAGRDLSYANVTVMKDSLALGMDLLADFVRRPTFAQEELERQRQQTLAALRVSYDDPEYVADAVFDRVVYGSGRYGFPATGTLDTLPAITRDDLVQFHRRYYAPNNCILAVVGDVTVSEAMPAVARAFGDWPRQAIEPDAAVAPPEPARRIVVLDKPDAVQAEIRMGQLGIARRNADFAAVDLAIRILGGEGANRLHRVLRTERGLTYGASAAADALRDAGEFQARTNTRTEATGEVLRIMADEFSRLRRERVGDTELADAKAYMTGSFPLTIETANDIATQVLNVVFYDLPADDLQTFRQRVNAVTVDDVERAATRYVRPDRLSIVVVGNASAFLGQLKGLGFGGAEVVRLSELDLASPDFRRRGAGTAGESSAASGRWPPGLPRPIEPAASPAAMGQGVAPGAGASAEDAGRALVDRAIAARGGLEKLQGIKTIKAVAQTTFNSPQGPVQAQTTTYIEYPDRVRVEARVALGDVVQVYAGEDNVWVKDPSKGVIVPPPAARRDFREAIRRDVVQLLLRAQAGQVKVRLVQPSSAAVAPLTTVQQVEFVAAGSDPVTLSIDLANGMVTAERYTLPAGGGSAEELFSDYRDVAGVKFPFRGAVRRAGLPVVERAVTDMKINVPIAPDLFTKPGAPK